MIVQNFEYQILCSLRRIIRAVDIYSRKINSEFGLTTPQLLCLYALDQSENITLSELSKTVNLGASTVNGILDRLEVKNYVKRERSTGDKRKVFLSITDTARNIVTKAPSLLQDKLSISLARLPESEQRVISSSLEKIVELMEAEEVDASPNLLPVDQINS